ncbi:MAG: glutathione S-transferase family protein [Proteobacteria bacterium]|nr:glutathione S-transferase family protein [Pseudomonadota bacterium]
MKIYGSVASPFVQRVLMAARIKGHEIPVEPPPGGGMQSPEFLAISPMGRIPVLDDNGWTLAESVAIVGYLEDVLDGPSVLPGDARQRAHARMIDALVSHELAGLRPIMVCKVFGMRDEPVLANEAMATVAAGLAAIETARDPAHSWAAGDEPGFADCLLLPLLTLMEIIDPIAGTARLIDGHPGLAAYRDRASASELGGRTVDEMKQAFAAIIERRRAQAQ